jgi:hypothetical protein
VYATLLDAHFNATDLLRVIENDWHITRAAGA